MPDVKRRWMLEAIAIFVVTAGLAVIINSLVGYDFHTEYSISRYVGLETWSAMLFAVGNFVVAYAILQYLYALGEAWRMSKWFYWVAVIMAIALIGLSMCPVGYFDPEWASYGASAPSRIHELCSRIMFAAMLFVTVAVALRRSTSKETRIANLVFIVYGGICLMGYLTKASWFTSAMLLFESLYLLSFMILCLFARRSVLQAKGVNDGN